MIALEVLLLLLAIAASILVYRALIRSKWFTDLVGGILNVPPETDAEVLDTFNVAEQRARAKAREAEDMISDAKETIKTIKRKLPRS
jgi:hypothetical protein